MTGKSIFVVKYFRFSLFFLCKNWNPPEKVTLLFPSIPTKNRDPAKLAFLKISSRLNPPAEMGVMHYDLSNQSYTKKYDFM